MTPGYLAMLAVIPMAIGPLPQGEGPVLVARLCAGGTITIPVRDREPQLPETCPFKACHAGSCRKKFDLEQ